MEEELKLIVKWNGTEYEIDALTNNDCVETLKDVIFKKTGVRPERQKLLNLKFKGKMPENDCLLGALNLKSGFKIMMMGSLESAINDANTVPTDLPEVIDDFDIEDEEVVPLEHKEVYLAKVARRIKEYKINVLNAPRPGMKLLVLDIDYTLFDHRSVAETGYELMRPYLHEFLSAAFRNYDIAIWSATNMKWIEEKMKLLGVANNPSYSIVFYLDCLAMISVHTKKYGLIQVKPLGVIWGQFPDQYCSSNTIMFDDIRRNFIMNPQNGLKIRPFKQAHLNRSTDRELLRLVRYLDAIAPLEDLTQLNHRHWEKYVSNVRKIRKRQKRLEESSTDNAGGNSGKDTEEDTSSSRENETS